MESPKKLLVVCHGAIGDVTRALPLLARMKADWPEVEIHWGVEPISYSLVASHPLVAKAHLFERPKGFSAYIDYIKRLREEQFEIVVDLQRHFKSGVTSFLTGASRRIGFNRKNSREFNWLFATEQVKAMPHYSLKTEQYQRFGDALGLTESKKLDFGLSPKAEEISKIDELFEDNNFVVSSDDKYVALLLGSTWLSRFWKADYYVELINTIFLRYGMRSILVGGRSEVAFAEEIMLGCDPEFALNLVEKTSLRDLVPVFSNSWCAVGSDSGPMHIAAGVGIPVISLWGATSPARSGPYGSEHLVLQSPIGCSPCYLKECPGLGTLCMADIPVQAVLARIESLLNK